MNDTIRVTVWNECRHEKEDPKVAEVYPETQALRRIKGVGALTALAFVLTLEDPQRFRQSRDVGPYLGLVPKRTQSGAEDPESKITKRGDKYLRRLLVGTA